MISAVYILKDSGKTILQSLESVKVVDEIICVVDNKTTDNTIKKIEEFRFKVRKAGNYLLSIKRFDYQWQNNFAQARNFAISKATSDWNFIIDGDEVLDSGEGLLKLASDNDVDIWSVIQLDKDGQMCQTFRLFRKGIKYRDTQGQDVIHESLEDNGYRKGKSDLVINHLKELTPEEHKQKIQWILDTFALIDEGAKKDYYEGIYHIHTGDHVKGMEKLNRCIDKVSPELKAFIYLAVAKHYLRISECYDIEGFAMLNKSLEVSPNQNEGWVKLAEYWLRKGEFTKAEECITTIKNKKNKLMTDLQNDRFYNNNQLEKRLNQIKEMRYGFKLG